MANPGCYPTGAIALLRPLVEAGILPPDYPVTVNAVSGYTGGGKAMIAEYEPARAAPPFFLYGLGLEHKHVPETAALWRADAPADLRAPRSATSRRACWSACRCTSTLLNGSADAGRPRSRAARRLCAAATWVARAGRPMPKARLEPEALNGTNMLELRVYGNADARPGGAGRALDNLGKGASGAAVQNIGLMLGVDVAPALPLAAE